MERSDLVCLNIYNIKFANENSQYVEAENIKEALEIAICLERSTVIGINYCGRCYRKKNKIVKL